MTMEWWFYEGVTDPTSLERLKQLHRVYKDKKKSKHLNVKRAVNALFVPRSFTLLHPSTFEVDMLEIFVKFCSSAPSKEPGEGAKKKATKQKAMRAPSPELGSSISLSDPIAREEKEDHGEEGGQDADPIAREEEEEDGEEGGQADGDTRGPCEFETYTHICTHTHMLSLDTHTHTCSLLTHTHTHALS
jgi:cobalamin biosynthesis protein CobT